MKKCNECGTDKPLSEFQIRKETGKPRACCKQCHYKKCIAWERENKEMAVSLRKEWANKNRPAMYVSTKKYKEKNRIKVRAKDKVKYAIRVGKIHQLPCEICNSPLSQAHHCDYSKPLDVMWLCVKHHKEWHMKNGSGINGGTATLA